MTSSVSCGVMVEYCGSVICYRHVAKYTRWKEIGEQAPYSVIFF